MTMNATTPGRAAQLALVADLRQRLADSEKELANPRLFNVTRRCIQERIVRLRDDIAALCRQLGEPVVGRLVTL